MKNSFAVSALITGLFLILCSFPVRAQDGDGQQQDISDEQLEQALVKWIDEYVRYIISEPERREWENLTGHEQKLLFIEEFWLRRDPSPGTHENEYREEYMQRWAYVNRHFTAGKPGWRTDRGRIYLMLGPPSDIERNPFGRNRTERPSEVWYYNSVNNRALPAVVEISFVDFMGYGDYEIVTDLDQTARFYSSFGISMNNLDAYALRRGGDVRPDDEVVSTMFDEQRIRHPELLSRNLHELQRELGEIARIPTLRLGEPGQSVRTQLSTADLDFSVDAKAFKSDGPQAALPVTLNIPLRNLSYTEAEGRRSYAASLYARVHSDAASTSFEETLQIAVDTTQHDNPDDLRYLYQFWMAVPAGDYRLNVTLRDNLSNAIGHRSSELNIPDFNREALSLSDIILADQITEVPRNEIAGVSEGRPFQFINRRVLPNILGSVSRSAQEQFFLYFQVYNFSVDAQENCNLEVQYFIYRYGQALGKQTSVIAQQAYDRLVIHSGFPLASLQPGSYRVAVIVSDQSAGTEALARGEIRFDITD